MWLQTKSPVTCGPLCFTCTPFSEFEMGWDIHYFRPLERKGEDEKPVCVKCKRNFYHTTNWDTYVMSDSFIRDMKYLNKSCFSSFWKSILAHVYGSSSFNRQASEQVCLPSLSETAGFCDSITYVVQLVRIMELLYSWKSREPKGTFFMIHQNIARFVVSRIRVLLIQKEHLYILSYSK